MSGWDSKTVAEYNTAVANGLAGEARRIARRADAELDAATPEAPKRSPSEAAHGIDIPATVGVLRELIERSWNDEMSDLEWGHLRSVRADFAVKVRDILPLLLVAIEREAAHSSGAGSGLREALEQINDTIGDGGRFNGSLAMLVRIRTIARAALAATPAVPDVTLEEQPSDFVLRFQGGSSSASRDGEVAAIAEALEALELGDHMDDENWPAALYDVGLRVAPSAPGDSLDALLDDLRLRIRGIGNYAYTKAALAQIDAVAELALAARLRSEPTGATPESEG